MIATANMNGGADNITVVVVEVNGRMVGPVDQSWKRSLRRGQDVETDAAV